MVTKKDVRILIEKHFDLLKKKNKTSSLKKEDSDMLIEYFSNLIYLLQFYNDSYDLGINGNKFMNQDDFITVLCACNNAGAS